MSDTQKDKDGIKNGSVRTKKSKAYLADKDAGSPKFYPSASDGLGITPLGKLVAKNANRSRKKAARQEADQEIKRALIDGEGDE